MEEIVNLIVAVSTLLSAVGGILGFVAAKFHLGKKVAAVADSLQETDDWVAEHEVQLKTGVKVAEELSPEAKALIDAHKEKIDALTAEVEAKTAALQELQKSFTGTTPSPTGPVTGTSSVTFTASNSGNTTTVSNG